MTNDECLHETLYFGSGDFYMICRKCQRYWRMEDSYTNNVGKACELSGQDRVTARPEERTQEGIIWTFALDLDQQAKLAAWHFEQDTKVLEQQKAAGTGDPFVAAVQESGRPYYGAIGGELTFIFTPTSIGTVAKVKHSSGAEIDLTDYEAW